MQNHGIDVLRQLDVSPDLSCIEPLSDDLEMPVRRRDVKPQKICTFMDVFQQERKNILVPTSSQ